MIVLMKQHEAKATLRRWSGSQAHVRAIKQKAAKIGVPVTTMVRCLRGVTKCPVSLTVVMKRNRRPLRNPSEVTKRSCGVVCEVKDFSPTTLLVRDRLSERIGATGGESELERRLLTQILDIWPTKVGRHELSSGSDDVTLE